MTRLLLASIVLSVLTTGACAPKKSEKLRDAISRSYTQDPCSKQIAMEWGASFGVPLADAEGRRFKIFYYAIEGAPGHPPLISNPLGEAVIDTSTGRPDECEALPVKPVPRGTDDGPSGQKGFTAAQAERSDEELDFWTEKIAKVYAAKQALSQPEVDVAKKYWRSFKANSEPLMQADYYRLNPDFWEWLRGVVGDSIPKPAK